MNQTPFMLSIVYTHQDIRKDVIILTLGEWVSQCGGAEVVCQLFQSLRDVAIVWHWTSMHGAELLRLSRLSSYRVNVDVMWCVCVCVCVCVFVCVCVLVCVCFFIHLTTVATYCITRRYSGQVMDSIPLPRHIKGVKIVLAVSLLQGSRDSRAVTRLAFQTENPGSIPGASSHIPFIVQVYIHRIHHRPEDGDVHVK